MKTGILIGIAAAVLSLFCGCAPTMTVNGQTYTVLTQSEEQELVTQARRLLGRPGKALNKEEVRFVQKTDPEVKIEYQGDRTGEAQIIWRTPEKIITMHFGGEFLTERMGWTFETEKPMPEVLKIHPAGAMSRRDPEPAAAAAVGLRHRSGASGRAAPPRRRSPRRPQRLRLPRPLRFSISAPRWNSPPGSSWMLKRSNRCG